MHTGGKNYVTNAAMAELRMRPAPQLALPWSIGRGGVRRRIFVARLLAEQRAASAPRRRKRIRPRKHIDEGARHCRCGRGVRAA